MGDDRYDDNIPGGIPLQDFNMYCGDDGTKGRRRGMGVVLGRRSAGGYMSFSD